MSSKLEYLQRYMGASSDAAEKKLRKKRKKDKSSAGSGTRIVDADHDWAQEASARGDLDDKWGIDAAEDEAPVIVANGEVDPEDLPVIANAHEYEAELQAKSASKNDDADDLSPPRRQRKASKDEDASPPRRRAHDDASPPRRTRKQAHHDEDASPPRRAGRSRAGDGDDDASPPRRSRAAANDDLSPPRRRGLGTKSSDDESPPRRRPGRRGSDDDASPPRRSKNTDNGDPSPQRRGAADRQEGGRGRDASPRNRSRTRDSRRRPGEASRSRSRGRQQRSRSRGRSARPARRRSRTRSRSTARRDRRRRSPSPRDKRSRRCSTSRSPDARRVRRDPRSLRRRSKSRSISPHSSPPRRSSKARDTHDDSPPRRSKPNEVQVTAESEMKRPIEQTEAGVKSEPVKDEYKPRAGLFTAEEFADDLKRKIAHNNILKGASAEDMGHKAETVYRDKKGRKLDMLNELVRQQEILDGKRAREAKEAYEWGTGRVQKEEKRNEQEMMKKIKEAPFARRDDDAELEALRRERVRAFDPINSKVFQDDSLFDAADGKKPKKHSKSKKHKHKTNSKPKYAGPPAPPNRFSIQPGYRWDGVVRGTGWEEKLMLRANTHNAQSDEAYRYAVADM